LLSTALKMLFLGLIARLFDGALVGLVSLVGLSGSSQQFGSSDVEVDVSIKSLF
jgi:hypothetical protein